MRARRTLATAAALAAAISILFASPALAVAASWTPPVNISTPAVDGQKQQVVIDSNGLATAVWVRGITVESSTSLNSGTWTVPVSVSEAQMADSPQITVAPSGLVTAVWVRVLGPNNIVESSTSLSGGAWSAPVVLSPFPGNATDPQLTVDGNGLVAAVWNDRDDGHIASSTALNGGAWTPPVNISATAVRPFTPQIAADPSGLVTAVWSSYDGLFDVSMVQASTSLNGGTWTQPVQLSKPGQDSYQAQVGVTANGLATAVWNSDVNSDSRIQSSSSLSGAAWSSPVGHAVSGDSAGDPHISASPSGLTLVTWVEGFGGPNRAEVSSSADGTTWSTPVSLSADGVSAHAARIAANSTGLTTAVFAADNGTDTIIQSSTSVDGVSWSAPVDVSESGHNAQDPHVVLDSHGLSTAVWDRFDASNTIVQSSSSVAPIVEPAPTPSSTPGTPSAEPRLAATGVNGIESGLLAAAAALLALIGAGVVVTTRYRRSE